MSKLTHVVKFNGEVAYTGANPQGGAVEGVSFAITADASELMPDPDFQGACGDTNWVCTDGVGTTVIGGGQASIGDTGSIELNNPVEPIPSPLNSYEITLEIVSLNTNVLGNILDVGGSTSTNMTWNIGTNIVTVTGTQVGTGVFRVQTGFSGDLTPLVISGWSFREVGGTVQATLVEHQTDMSAPNDIIAYDVTWTTDPIMGDVVEWGYIPGNYIDIDESSDTVLNGDFSAGDANWTYNIDGTIIYDTSGGFLSMDRNSGAIPRATQTLILSAGQEYQLTYDLLPGNANNITITIGGVDVVLSTPAVEGSYGPIAYTPTLDNEDIVISSIGSLISVLNIDNISLAIATPMEAQALTLTNCADIIPPASYDIDFYGDSFGDSVTTGGIGWMGEGVAAYTSQASQMFTIGVGGETLAEIRTRFELAFPNPAHNTIVLQGGNNDLVQGRAVNLMIDDMRAMADIVIANRHFYLSIVGLSQRKGSPNWDTAEQADIITFNDYFKANYPSYYVDAYASLGDPADTEQLADFAYKDARTNPHPNKAADRAVDNLIARVINAPQIAPYDLTEPVPDYMLGTYRFFDDYTKTLCDIGGPSVICADGTPATGKGVIAVANTTSTKTVTKGTDTLAIGSTYVASVLMIAAADDFGRLQMAHDGDLTQAWVDLRDGTLGTQTASTGLNETWTSTKLGFGWVRLSCEFTATGATFASMRITPCPADNVTATDAWDRTVVAEYPPHMYIDAMTLTDA